MLKEAEMWRQADQARRKIVELKNECDIFISKVEDQIKIHKVNEILKRRLEENIEDLRSTISD